MTQMVLDELEGHPRIEQVGRDRMAEAMAGVAGRETCSVSVAAEEVLNLSLAERTRAAGKERPLRRTGVFPEIAV
jgi:hypothetical protein